MPQTPPKDAFYKKGTNAKHTLANIRRKLLSWYRSTARDLPWRRSRDPYHIWLSEIMLQQTRVATVIPYYERFLARFPNLEALAAAPEPDLLAAWAGLGYYYRARNLQAAAQKMQQRFPAEYDAIRALPGVGEYTAAAVASIAFDLPHAAVDGNVLRVLSRVTGDSGEIGSSVTRQRIAAFADQLLDRSAPGAFNQALMELGATVCVPKQPQCLICPIADECVARAEGLQNELPVKAPKQRQKKVEKTVYLVVNKDRILLFQRPAAERLMPGFWDVPEQAQLPDVSPGYTVGEFRHSITTTDYTFFVRSATVPRKPRCMSWVPLARLGELPLSTITRKALRFLRSEAEL